MHHKVPKILQNQCIWKKETSYTCIVCVGLLQENYWALRELFSSNLLSDPSFVNLYHFENLLCFFWCYLLSVFLWMFNGLLRQLCVLLYIKLYFGVEVHFKMTKPQLFLQVLCPFEVFIYILLNITTPHCKQNYWYHFTLNLIFVERFNCFDKRSPIKYWQLYIRYIGVKNPLFNKEGSFYKGLWHWSDITYHFLI